MSHKLCYKKRMVLQEEIDRLAERLRHYENYPSAKLPSGNFEVMVELHAEISRLKIDVAHEHANNMNDALYYSDKNDRLRARLAEVEAERDRYMENFQRETLNRSEAVTMYEGMKALFRAAAGTTIDERSRAEQAEAREKAKDERIRELEGALREVLRVCVRVDGLDMRDFSAVLSTPSPSQPVKVAEEKCECGVPKDKHTLASGYWICNRYRPAEKPCEPITSVDGLCHTHPRGHCPPAEKPTMVANENHICSTGTGDENGICRTCGISLYGPPAEKLTGTGEES